MNLENLKMVFFDFDDTLCIHTKHQTDSDYSRKLFKYGFDVYDDCESSPHMKKLLDLCVEQGIRVGLMSCVACYQHAETKRIWVADNYGVELENFCVGVQEAKSEMLEKFVKAVGYAPDEVALVDDWWYHLERVSNLGFRAYSPLQVVNFIDGLK